MNWINSTLEELYIPESITNIEGLCASSFKSNCCMKKIDVNENNLNYWSDGKALYTKKIKQN